MTIEQDILIAAAQQNFCVVKELCETNNIAPDTIANEHGNTPLHFAAMTGTREQLENLLELANNNAPINNEGRTPSDYARSNVNTEVADLFMIPFVTRETHVIHDNTGGDIAYPDTVVAYDQQEGAHPSQPLAGITFGVFHY